MAQDEFDPNSLDPQARERIAAQVPVVRAAWAFLEPIRGGRFDQAWLAVDPVTRRCWAQHRLYANRHQLQRDGYDPEDVTAEFVNDEPDHPLWEHFVRAQLQFLHTSLTGLDPEHWGIGAAPRPVAPDVELLYLHDTSTLPGNVWQVDEERPVWPMLMRYVGRRWLVLNVATDSVIPEPGWPPRILG
ncbi:hypothetical protein [Pseudonocardia sp. H11422]|uniref:hypothetical protein n=1 Tax=Pseudonocardia sp. H11422 TaxID=2835866 RepID=UPI001BDCC2BC|nr:hypothetical protein [Pseudonocardia sp. H11422]